MGERGGLESRGNGIPYLQITGEGTRGILQYTVFAFKYFCEVSSKWKHLHISIDAKMHIFPHSMCFPNSNLIEVF